MSQELPSKEAIFNLVASPDGLQIIHFQNGDTINLIRSKDCTVYKISAAPRLKGATPTHIASIVFNDHFPALKPVHLQAILDFIADNFANTQEVG